MKSEHIIWEWWQRTGLEHLHLRFFDEVIRAEGLVIADTEGWVLRFRYSLVLTPDWKLIRGGVFGPNVKRNSLLFARNNIGGWEVDGGERVDLNECCVSDIIGTPILKTATVKSLGLHEGERKKIKVALVDPVKGAMSAVDQNWIRLADEDEHSHYICAYQEREDHCYFNRNMLVTAVARKWRRVN